MKISELFESIAATIDREIDRHYGKAKAVQSDEVKAKNAYVRGFRGAFAGGGASDTGIGKDFLPDYNRGLKDGAKARKKAGEVPEQFITKNKFGDKKPNPAFEKAVKAALAEYESDK